MDLDLTVLSLGVHIQYINTTLISNELQQHSQLHNISAVFLNVARHIASGLDTVLAT